MKNINIKESNYWAIHDFALLSDNTRLQGTKLKALYQLIQKKGEPIKTDNEELKGHKVLMYGDREYIGFIHTPIRKGCFFPCKLKTISLTEL